MQKSTDATRMGANRTGLQASPTQSTQMNDVVVAVTSAAAHTSALAETRVDYIREADSLGSIPPPVTIKGLVKSGKKMMKGDRPQAFIDKLAERLAFERGGTRLYDAVIAKFIGNEDELDGISLEQLQEIRDDEASHAALIKACIEQLGGDSTAQTPSADLVGVETMGFIQAVSDPRTTLAQTLHAALAAELIDGEGWETLIAMAESIGQDTMVERFHKALTDENEHLAKVRTWYSALIMESSKAM